MEQRPRRSELKPPPAKDKPKLVPPPAPRYFSPDTRLSGSKFALVLAFAIVTLGAMIGVIVILPEQVTRPPDATITRSEAPEPGGRIAGAPEAAISGSRAPEPTEPTGGSQKAESPDFQAQAKMEAETLLRTVLRIQARIENDGVKIWGTETLVTNYSEALAKLAAANAHLDAQRFDSAVENYRKTLSLFNQLEESRPDRLQNAMRSGMESLERLDDEAAKTWFQLALALDPANSSAKQGLNRAGNLRRVIDWIQRGQAFESNGEFDQARDAYAEAIALDGHNQSAPDRLRQIDELILTRDFQHAISTALAALERKEYVESQLALDRADRLRPNVPEVLNISLKLREARQFAALERIRGEAARHEEGERWQQALQAYERALRIDENTSFAIRGKSRAMNFVKLNQQVEYYLANPDRLQSPDPIAHAREVLKVANAISDVGAKLRDKRDRLQKLIDGFNTPRSVILRSDEKTDITVYQVSRLGLFSERRMMLRPGVYTAVGSRAGYRDVRIRFRVPPSTEETTVIIRCEEKI